MYKKSFQFIYLLFIVPMCWAGESDSSGRQQGCNCNFDALRMLSTDLVINHEQRGSVLGFAIATKTKRFKYSKQAPGSDIKKLCIHFSEGAGMSTKEIPWQEICELPCWLLTDHRQHIFSAMSKAFSGLDEMTGKQDDLLFLLSLNARFLLPSELSDYKQAIAGKVKEERIEKAVKIAEISQLKMAKCAQKGDPRGVIDAWNNIKKQKRNIPNLKFTTLQKYKSGKIFNSMKILIIQCKHHAEEGRLENACNDWKTISPFLHYLTEDTAEKITEWWNGTSRECLQEMMQKCVSYYETDSKKGPVLKTEIELLSKVIVVSPKGYEIFRQDIRKELLRQAKERKELIGVMTAKGLVEFRGSWITPEERQRILLAEESERQVNQLSKINADFHIIQVLDVGVLIAFETSNWSTGEYALLKGSDLSTVATSVKYQSNIYWTGNFTYETRAGLQKTILTYHCNKTAAVKEVTTQKFIRAGLLPAEKNPGGGGTGSGFAITHEGHIATCHHVIDGANQIYVLVDGKKVEARVVASDPDFDLSILKIRHKTNPIPIQASEASLGQSVLVIGFPDPTLQGELVKVTEGIISSLGGMESNPLHYQIDASVQGGNSGGPMITPQGGVLGVVVSRLNDRAIFRETGLVPQNVNYAVKAGYLLNLINRASIQNKVVIWRGDEKNRQEIINTTANSTYMIIAR